MRILHSFFCNAHDNQMNQAAGVIPVLTAPNILQNVHDIRSVQSLGIILSGMTPSPAHIVSMLSMLQAAELGLGPRNTGSMNSAAMAGIPAITIPTPSTGVMSEEALSQPFLSAVVLSGVNLADNTLKPREAP